MPAIEYNVVAAGEKPVGQMNQAEVMRLAWEMNSPVLFRCCQMYEAGVVSWPEAMQTAAIELTRICDQQHKELVRLTGLRPPTAIFSNAGVNSAAEGSPATERSES